MEGNSGHGGQTPAWGRPPDLPEGGTMSCADVVRGLEQVHGVPLRPAAAQVLDWLDSADRPALWLHRPDDYPQRLAPNATFPSPRQPQRRIYSRGLVRGPDGGFAMDTPSPPAVPRVSALEWLRIVWLEAQDLRAYLACGLGADLHVGRAEAQQAFRLVPEAQQLVQVETRPEVEPQPAPAAGERVDGLLDAQWSEEEKQAMRDARARGEPDTSIAKRYGFTRQRLAELIGSKTEERLKKAEVTRSKRAS